MMAIARHQPAQATPEWPVQHAFGMRRERAHQPVGRLRLPAGFTRGVRQSQKTRGATPALIRARQLRFVKFGDLIELLNQPISFRDRLAYFVQAISGHGQRQMLALVTVGVYPDVQVVIEIVIPALLETFTNDPRAPEVTRLRRRISP